MICGTANPHRIGGGRGVAGGPYRTSGGNQLVKQTRIQRGLIQAEVGTALGIPGLAVSFIENQNHKQVLRWGGEEIVRRCQALADFLGLDLWDVLLPGWVKTEPVERDLDLSWCWERRKHRFETEDPLTEILRQEQRQRVRFLLSCLDYRSQEIVWKRMQGQTLSEVGSAVGLTRERVRQIEHASMKTLINWIKEEEW